MKAFWTVLGVVVVIVLGVIDTVSGYELAFSLFYLFPIALVVWNANGRLGLVVSAASALAWFMADLSSGNAYTNGSIFLWNTIIRLGFFIIVTALLAAFKDAYNTNLKLLRTDYISGAMSARFFYEHAQIEIARSKRTRQPLTLAFLDLDDFKAINDRYGHSTGDRVLQAVASSAISQIRGMDLFARLGGDEFVLLLSDAGEMAARAALTRIQERIRAEMLLNGWSITFSVGVVTFLEVPETVDDMVRLADAAMYEIKSTSKSGMSFHIQGQPPA